MKRQSVYDHLKSKQQQQSQQPNPTVIKTDLSSIESVTQVEHSKTEEDIDSVLDLEELKQHDYYRSRDPLRTFLVARGGDSVVKDIFKNLLSSVVNISIENDMMRKIPLLSVFETLNLLSVHFISHTLLPEDIEEDLQSQGLEEDQEPELKKLDPWIRSKVVIDVRPVLTQTIDDTDVRSKHGVNHSQLNTTSLGFRNPSRQQGRRPSARKDLEPTPIDLNEPLDISFNEERMRNEKERQQKEKSDLMQAENRKRMRELKEEQMKYEMLAKDKKAKQFTYDYDGKLIPVNLVKTHKLPPATYNVNSNFLEDPNKANQAKLKKKPTIPQSSSMASLLQPKKKTPEEEKEFVKFLQNAPPILDSLPLQMGVTIQYEGKSREGPRPSTVELATLSTANSTLRMPRKDYIDIVKQGNLNRQSQTVSVNEQKVQAQTRDFDGYATSNIFNFERLKRQQLSPQNQQEGGIKINSTKIFETLTRTIPEDEEFEKPPQDKKQAQSQQTTLKVEKSPVDEFNLAIAKNQNWGKEAFVTAGGIKGREKLIKNHARDKDLPTIIGCIPKKPRDRAIPTKIPQDDLSEGLEIPQRAQTVQESKRIKI